MACDSKQVSDVAIFGQALGHFAEPEMNVAVIRDSAA
jgi:hypothetical protein